MYDEMYEVVLFKFLLIQVWKKSVRTCSADVFGMLYSFNFTEDSYQLWNG